MRQVRQRQRSTGAASIAWRARAGHRRRLYAVFGWGCTTLGGYGRGLSACDANARSIRCWALSNVEKNCENFMKL
jgi:hypothetical protein